MRPGTAGFLAAIAIFLACLVVARRITHPGTYTFEPRGPGSFEPRLGNYARLVEIVIGLATGSIVLLAGSSIFRSGGKLPRFYGSPLVLLAMSVIYAVAFLALLVRAYEEFLHDEKSYTRNLYALNTSLGFASLICFALGYVWLGFVLASG
jgi:hypothetical protein